MSQAGASGIVRNGQVIVGKPLDLPDGSEVEITPREVPSVSPGTAGPLTAEILAELAAFWRREKTWDEAERRIRELQARS